MRILIATGVYPPEAGGPAFYAKSLKDEFEKLEHTVAIRTFTLERSLPTGVRHLWYFLKTFPSYVRADCVLVFDTFSVGFPIALMYKVLRRRTILRIGGDFVWEQYVERTKEKVLLSQFYKADRIFSFKERLIVRATKFVLRTIPAIVFNTEFQKNIWIPAYQIPATKTSVIENRFEPPIHVAPVNAHKTFVYAAARPLVWKNADMAERAFDSVRRSMPDARLEFLFGVSREEAIQKIKDSYACILTSLGDLGPNYILRALSFGKPVILSREIGIRDRVGDIALYVDPLDPQAIADAVVRLCDPNVYADYQRRVATIHYTHTYADIAQEFLTLCQTL